jgi:tRNA(Ile)-lysidine synthase
MVEKTFNQTIAKYKLLKRKDSLLLGVSGGPDSICMLQLFCQLREQLRLNLVCVHFNHKLRAEADQEEEFVRDICKQNNIKFSSQAKKVTDFFTGDSLEQTARNLRFDFFLSCSRRLKIKKIALAHNHDDVAETVLMRMVRGTALKGLRGILPQTKMAGIKVIRPLIDVPKSEILAWLKDNEFEYAVDKSNLEDKFFRNKVRLKLLPLLESWNPRIRDSLVNLARTAAMDYEFIYAESKKCLAQIKKQKGRNYLKLDLKSLQSLDLGMRLNVLRLSLEELKGNTRRLELRHLEEVEDLLAGRPDGSIVDLPGWEVKKEEPWLIIKFLLTD